MGLPIAELADLEDVQVVVLPPHCRLEDRMKLGKLDLAGHQQSPPDCWCVLHERDAQLDNGLARSTTWWSDHARRLGERQSTSSEVGPNLMITVGPNQVDIPSQRSSGEIPANR